MQEDDLDQDLEIQKVRCLGKNKPKIEAIYTSLVNKQDKNLFHFYQMVLDEVIILPRTNNLSDYWGFLDFLDPSAPQKLEIASYIGQSYRSNRHRFALGKPLPEVLSKEEFDRRVQEEFNKWVKDQELDKTIKQNKSLKAKVKKQAKEIEALLEENERLRASNFDRDNLAVAKVINQLVIHAPHLVEKFPQLKEFSGLFGLEIPEKTEGSPPP